MNDLDLLRDLGHRLDPPAPAPHDRIRARIGKEIAASGARDGASRLVWLAPVGAAAAVTGLLLSGVAVPGLAGGPDRAGRTGSGAAAGSTSPDAQEILLGAAAAMRSTSVPEPAPGAFVYSREKQVAHVSTSGPHGSIVTDREETVVESWLSADGRKDGAVVRTGGSLSGGMTLIPGCSTADQAKRGGVNRNGLPLPCTPEPGYLADLPDTATAALARIRTAPDGKPVTGDAQAFMNARELLDGCLTPADARAAIFEAISRLDGLQVVPDVVTASGRTGVGVGVGRGAGDTREEIVFDPRTHELIGYRTVALEPTRGQPAGTVLASSSPLEQAVVGASLIRPDGTRWTKPRAK